MIPNNSNTLNTGCSPVSSNCVIWQGPNLGCIQVFTGDNISAVTHKLAVEICALKEQLNVSDIDLKCLFDSCVGCADEGVTLAIILQLLVNKVCSMDELYGSPSAPTEQEGLITIASCLRVADENGDIVSQLPHLEYTRRLGSKVCEILTTVGQHETKLTDHENRITELEKPEADADAAMITPVCVLPAVPQTIEEVVEAMEEQFCQLRTATGTPAALSQAVGKQCVNLATASSLSSGGLMSNIPGWIPAPVTVADTLNNLWLTLCDIRSAVVGVQACCAVDCSDIAVDFTVSITANGTLANLFFAGYTDIPDGFENCESQGSKLTVTDGSGHSHITYINLTNAAESSAPITINLSGTSLDLVDTLHFKLDSCLTDGKTTCSKTIIKDVRGTFICEAPTNVTATLS